MHSLVEELIYILSSFSSFLVSSVFSSSKPFAESGLIFLKAKIISFFKLSANVSGHVTEIIILVSVCSMRQIGKTAFFIICSVLAPSFLLKLFVLLILRSKYFSKSHSSS